MAGTAANNLEDVLAELQKTADTAGAKVSVGEIVGTFGKRSFGPLLLLGGLLGMTPVAAIPTAPSIIAVITLLVSVQLLFGRRAIWLPHVLEKLAVKADKVRKTVRITQKPARIVDRVVRPRLQALTKPWADRVVAAVCAVIALCVPPLELLPFAAFFPSLAIATFGLGLIARDGLIVLVAHTVSLGILGLLAGRFLF